MAGLLRFDWVKSARFDGSPEINRGEGREGTGEIRNWIQVNKPVWRDLRITPVAPVILTKSARFEPFADAFRIADPIPGRYERHERQIP
jgi:hypothetical protein